VTSVFYAWSAIRAAGEVVAEGFEPDIIHAHIYEAGVPSVLFGRRRRIPVIITEHSSDFPRRRLPPLQVLKARFAFSQAERVLPVSQALRHGIEEHGISNRFAVVPNAVDTDLFRPRPGPRAPSTPHRLLYVGSLIPVKGLDLLLRALAGLRSRRSDWHLDVMGDGSDRAACQALVRELGLDGKVTFHGQISKADVATAMAGADLLVVPSRWENAPCVIIEAMACGLPVLATRVGGIPEIVDDEIGMLVPGEDVEQLAGGVDSMLRKLPEIDRRHIRQRAERYSLDSVGNELHMIYREVIARSLAGRSGARRPMVFGPSRVRKGPVP
jgi:glycosyltransferase involved in cell wall biosynthesis